MLFRHDNFLLDLEHPPRTTLYKDNKLLFLVVGNKAIYILLRKLKISAPVDE